MARKSFKGGLDNLLASAGIKKKIPEQEKVLTKKELAKVQKLTDEEKHWLIIKNENLKKELALWRTGNLSVEEFHNSIKKFGLKYDVENNELVED